MFSWWRQWRRRRLLAAPFPEAWESWITAGCRPYAGFDEATRDRLRRDVTLLVQEKHWEGCGGQIVTDEMRVTIAASAALMGLGFPASPFDRLLSILIYPDTFVAQPKRRQSWGLEEESGEPRLGEAWYQGPVILAWREITAQAHGDTGRNLVIHEFAHLLDMANAEVDGVPDLEHVAAPTAWAAAFEGEYRRFLRQNRLGRARLLDDYAGTSLIEFFAVGSEVFFSAAPRMLQELPTLYGLLRQYYQQDPAKWT